MYLIRGVITTKATKAAALVDFLDYNKLYAELKKNVLKITWRKPLSKRKDPVYLRSFLLGRKIKTVWAISYSLLYVVSKINQGSCLGCLGGDDAPDIDNLPELKPKGQLISEWLLDDFIWNKKRMKIFLYFCPTSLRGQI